MIFSLPVLDLSKRFNWIHLELCQGIHKNLSAGVGMLKDSFVSEDFIDEYIAELIPNTMINYQTDIIIKEDAIKIKLN